MSECAWTVRTFVSVAFLLAHTTVSAGPLSGYGVFVYSNLCVEDQSGDIAGTRITIHHYREGDSVLYEYSNGALSSPVLADHLKIDKYTKQVKFNVLVPGQEVESVTGELLKNESVLVLRGDWCGNAQAKIPLRLVNDFGRGMGRCPPCPRQ